MAERIFVAASRGERDPDKLWEVAIRGINPPLAEGAPA
jgi:hypothetical protein